MPFAENFHPEWGVLAPAPSFLRTVRIVLVATAIGATAGAGTVLALMDRPASETPKAVSASAAMGPVVAEETSPGAITPGSTTFGASTPGATTTDVATSDATPPNLAPAPAPAAALSALNSASVTIATEKTQMAARDIPVTPATPAAAPASAKPPAPAATAAAPGSAEKAAVKKRHKTVRRTYHPHDANIRRERWYDRDYNTAYRQW
jgi:hypothetical protein